MRRKDREITDFNELLGIVKRCSVCRVAFFDEAYPYIIPLNFGYEEKEGALTLFFHCANAGKKIELIQKNNHVAFEMDIPKAVLAGDKACDYTMPFESVCGNGVIEIAGDDGKIPALSILMRQYSDKTAFEFDPADVKAVTILKLTVNALTGKRLIKD